MTIAWTPDLRSASEADRWGKRVCRACGHIVRGPRWPAQLAISVATCAFGVPEQRMYDSKGGHEATKARAFAVWMLRAFGENQRSYPEIGKILDRHHSTAIQLHLTALSLRLEDKVFQAACRAATEEYCDTMEVPHVCS